MLRYILTASVLKCFSMGSWMPRLYRKLGNVGGGRRRGSGPIPTYYLERVRRMLRLQKQYSLVHGGDRILELGTGWMHWEALTTRLFYDTQAFLFDVWDNRQLNGLKNYAAQLEAILSNHGFDVSPKELIRARTIIQQISKTNSFDELYRLLNFTYYVNSSGSLEEIPSHLFKLVVSGGVLEHVKREAVPSLLAEMHRVLEPGGWALHSVDTQDHLSHYDPTVSKKLYLTCSEWKWKYLYENSIQYVNRIQRGEWLDLFRTAGFILVDEDSWNVDIGPLKLAARYANMDRRDLECGVLRVLFRKAI